MVYANLDHVLKALQINEPDGKILINNKQLTFKLSVIDFALNGHLRQIKRVVEAFCRGYVTELPK